MQQIPKETEVLIFNGNRVPYMVNNVIGMTNEHELLKVIDFSNNRIQEISGKAFHKVSNVEKLILDHNDLSISGKTEGLNNIIFVALTCFHLTIFLERKIRLAAF